MALNTAVASSQTLEGSLTGSDIETRFNAAVASLLNNNVVSVHINVDDQPRRQGKSIDIQIGYDDSVGEKVLTSPYKVRTFVGTTLSEALAEASTFRAANPTYFFPGPIHDHIVPFASANKPYVVFQFYSEDGTNAPFNWFADGSTILGDFVTGSSGLITSRSVPVSDGAGGVLETGVQISAGDNITGVNSLTMGLNLSVGNNATISGTAVVGVDPGGSELVRVGGDLLGSSLVMSEKAAASASVAGKGQLWTRNDTPSVLVYTDDVGTDFVIGSAATVLPAGTTANSLLRWSGTQWLEETDARLDSNGILWTLNTTDATSASTGAIQSAGGISSQKTVWSDTVRADTQIRCDIPAAGGTAFYCYPGLDAPPIFGAWLGYHYDALLAGNVAIIGSTIEGFRNTTRLDSTFNWTPDQIFGHRFLFTTDNGSGGGTITTLRGYDVTFSMDTGGSSFNGIRGLSVDGSVENGLEFFGVYIDTGTTTIANMYAIYVGAGSGVIRSDYTAEATSSTSNSAAISTDGGIACAKTMWSGTVRAATGFDFASSEIGGLITQSNDPSVLWMESDASANNGVWQMRADGETFYFRALSDALNFSGDIFSVERTGAIPDSILFSPALMEVGGTGLTDVVLQHSGQARSFTIGFGNTPGTDASIIGYGSSHGANANEIHYKSSSHQFYDAAGGTTFATFDSSAVTLGVDLDLNSNDLLNGGAFSGTTISASTKFLAADGSAAAPSISFTGDTDTGIYRVGANQLGIAVNGSKMVEVDTTGIQVEGWIKIEDLSLADIGDTLTYFSNDLTFADLAFATSTLSTTASLRTSANLISFRNASSDSMGTVNDGLWTLPNCTVSSLLKIASGSAAAPSLIFASDIDTGIYRAGNNQLGFATGGANRATLSSIELALQGDLSLQGGVITLGAIAPSLIITSNTGSVCELVFADDGSTVPYLARFEVTPNQFDFRTGIDASMGTINATAWSPSGVVRAANGSVSAPTYSFGSDSNTGIYRVGANQLGIAVNGSKMVEVDTTGIQVSGSVEIDGTATLSAISPALNVTSNNPTFCDLAFYTSTPTPTASLRTYSNTINFRDATTGNMGIVASGLWTLPNCTVSSLLKISNGSAAAPSLSFTSDTDTGIYRVGANEIGFATGGSPRVFISATQIDIGLPLYAQYAVTEGTPALDAATRWLLQNNSTSITSVGLSIISGTTGISQIFFGDADDEDAGAITYNNSTDVITLRAAGADRATLSSSALTLGSGVGLTVPGTFTSSATALFASGSAAAPSISFTGDTDTGIYRVGANQLGVAVNGSKMVEVDTTGIQVEGWIKIEDLSLANIAGTLTYFSNDMTFADLAFATSTLSTTASLRTSANLISFRDASSDSMGTVNDGLWTLPNCTVSSLLKIADGTAAAPSLSFTSDTDTGIYRVGANQLGIAVNGSKIVEVDTTGIQVSGSVEIDGTTTLSAISPALNVTSNNATFCDLAFYTSTPTPTASLRTYANTINFRDATTGNMGTVASGLWTLPNCTVSSLLKIASGSAAAPSLIFATDIDTGIYRAGNNEIGFATGGVNSATLSSTGLTLSAALSATTISASTKFLAANGSAAAPSLSFTSDTDTGIYRVGANEIGFATGGSLRLTVDSTGISARNATPFNWQNGTASEAWNLTGYSGVGLAFPYFTPTGSTENIVLNIFPNGAASDRTANTGVAWLDIFSTDLEADGTNYECLRLGKKLDGVGHVSCTAGGTGTVRNLHLQYNGGQVLFPNGSNSEPSIAFASETDTGIYRVGADALGIATNGAASAVFVNTFTTPAGTSACYIGDGLFVSRNSNGPFIVLNHNDTDKRLYFGQHGASSDQLRIVPYDSSFDFTHDFYYDFTNTTWVFDGGLEVQDNLTLSSGSALIGGASGSAFLLRQSANDSSLVFSGSTVSDATAARMAIYGKTHASVANQIWTYGDIYFRALAGATVATLTSSSFTLGNAIYGYAANTGNAAFRGWGVATSSTGTAAGAYFSAQNSGSSNSCVFGVGGTGHSTTSFQNRMVMWSHSDYDGISLIAAGASDDIRCYAGGSSTLVATIDSRGVVSNNTVATLGLTAMTDEVGGFFEYSSTGSWVRLMGYNYDTSSELDLRVRGDTIAMQTNGTTRGTWSDSAFTLSNIPIVGGASATAFQIRSSTQNALLYLIGGTTGGTDGSIQIYGSSHATQANITRYMNTQHKFMNAAATSTFVSIESTGLYINGICRCDSFQLDQVPTTETIVVDKTITVVINGANHKIPCKAV